MRTTLLNACILILAPGLAGAQDKQLALLPERSLGNAAGRLGLASVSITIASLESGAVPSNLLGIMGKRADLAAMHQVQVRHYRPNDPQRAKAEELLADARKHSVAFQHLLIFTVANQSQQALAVTVEAAFEGLGEKAVSSRSVESGQIALIRVTPDVSDARLRALAEQTTVPLRCLVRAGSDTIADETYRITLLSVNDFVWLLHAGDLALGIDAVRFVTPHDAERRIDRLLKAAAERMPNRAIVGYQAINLPDRGSLSHIQVVMLQVEAVYTAISDSGYKYVNAPLSIEPRAQRVKYPAQCLEDRSGNCLESSLLLASAMEAVGFEPVLVFMPGHAIVGVRSWEDDDSWAFVEATGLGSMSFSEAHRLGTELSQRPDAKWVDVRQLRALGVAPLPQ